MKYIDLTLPIATTADALLTPYEAYIQSHTPTQEHNHCFYSISGRQPIRSSEPVIAVRNLSISVQIVVDALPTYLNPASKF